MGVAFHARLLHSKSMQFRGLLADDVLQLFLVQAQACAVLQQKLGGQGRRRLLVQAGEAHGVIPGAARRAVADDLRAGAFSPEMGSRA